MPNINAHSVTPLFQVYDMPTSVSFYRDVLGFEVVTTSSFNPNDENYRWCMLRLGGATIMLNTKFEDDKRPATPPSTVNHDDVALYFSCDDVDGTYAQVRAKWPHVQEPKTAYYGAHQMYMTDPDGYVLCFQQPAR